MENTEQMNVQPRELEELKSRLVGEYDIDLTMTMPNGDNLRSKGYAMAEEISLGFGVRTTLRANIPGIGPYEEHDLWSFDRWEKKMHFYSVTSTGAVHDHVGGWTSANVLRFEWRGLYQGKPATESVSLTFSTGEISVHEVDTSDGQQGPISDFVLKRRR